MYIISPKLNRNDPTPETVDNSPGLDGVVNSKNE